MAGNVLKDKSYSFALLVVQRYKSIVSEKKEFVISKQILRSGTAIGALIREAEFAESKKDFIHKMSIALKEANENIYWLDLLRDSEFIETKVHADLYQNCKELVAMLVSSIKTAKSKLD
ncbi:four helix bundle protein [Christiangramia sp. SM2212]|uniref:Four helix bundle protein n=1 Tax=Christiangramia sediminicola TaxID=3073267 RepID=A0ABU1EUY6_9FLAO|nr:four helix bundle protein [Christiangramia sp. SM2212]MDR5591973.1 four helix bundle protein [Christiangramia sp. SM2212]